MQLSYIYFMQYLNTTIKVKFQFWYRKNELRLFYNVDIEKTRTTFRVKSNYDWIDG